MARVICTLPNAACLINGIEFEPHEGGKMISKEDLAPEIAEAFVKIPGYSAAPAKAPANTAGAKAPAKNTGAAKKAATGAAAKKASGTGGDKDPGAGEGGEGENGGEGDDAGSAEKDKK